MSFFSKVCQGLLVLLLLFVTTSAFAVGGINPRIARRSASRELGRQSALAAPVVVAPAGFGFSQQVFTGGAFVRSSGVRVFSGQRLVVPGGCRSCAGSLRLQPRVLVAPGGTLIVP